MKALCSGVALLVVLAQVLLTPTLAAAQDVTITDWRGVSIAATEGSVDSNGVKIMYHTVGDEGPLVIFVHGITGPWFDFRHQMVMLSEKYRVVSMSTRGTDMSDKPVGDEHYVSARVADDIEAIIDHFGDDKATIVGQDAGGLHAWHFAFTRPERTERLVALGSVHPAGLIRELMDSPDQQKAGMFQQGLIANPGAAQAFGERLRGRPLNPNMPAELAQLQKDSNMRTDAASVVSFFRANWPRSPVTMDTVAFGFKYGEFPPVQAPVLLIYGKADGAFLNSTLNDMWEWVEAPLTIHVLPGIGHGPHTEVAEFTTPRMMEWLETGR